MARQQDIKVFSMMAEFGRFCCFVGQFVTQGLLARRQGRASAARGRVFAQMYEIGNRSVPVVMITGAFVGMTLAVQSYNQFKGIGLEDWLGSLINISVVKELGPVLAAVMLAGRVGGAMTAELGTMRVTDQIDALRSMGVDPISHLIVPRFLACIVLMPCLIIYADVMGVLGGYVIGVWHFGINSEAYWRYSADMVEKWDLFVGVSKGLFFGASIALISCFKGFNCRSGAQGVGRACTEAFVYSFLSILIIDLVLVLVFKAIYDTFWGTRLFF